MDIISLLVGVGLGITVAVLVIAWTISQWRLF